MDWLVGPLARKTQGRTVADLHSVLGEAGYQVARDEMDGQTYGPSTETSVRAFQRDHHLPETGMVDAPTVAVLRGLPLNAQAGRSITGTVVFSNGARASELEIRLYHRVFGGEDTFLAKGSTVADGSFSLDYEAPDPVNLEVRALDANGDEVSISQTCFGAARRERLDLIAPSALRPLAAEYTRLTQDAEKALGAGALARAQEGGAREDLSIASRATKWDARLLALAATAQKMSATTEIPADTLYGLFRVGLPTDPARLARVSDKAIDQALSRAGETNIITARNEDLAAARTAIAKFQRGHRLEGKAAGTLSSLGELLDAAGLKDDERTSFEQVYFSAPRQELWKASSERLAPQIVERLRTQGKLAALTLNNAPLMGALREHVGQRPGVSGLVDAGFYDPSKWTATVRAVAGRGPLDALIPSAYAGETPEGRLAGYAADMARKIRLAFPTRVVGNRLANGELALRADGEAVGALLKTASELGFKLGRMSADAFFAAEHPGLGRPDAKTLEGVRTVQRVFQMAPSDEAMGVLFDADLLSAHDVVSLGRERFMAKHGGSFTRAGEAALVYRRCEQVSSVTYSLFTNARSLDSAPPIAAVTVQGAVDSAKANITKHFPSMAELFGSMDFCECEECRSVLSPAAYLVDLLHYLDPPAKVWGAFTNDWNAKHAQRFADNFAADYDKPYAQLDRRRPDIKSLPLTCENTNTALPYIDVVNEILEYYVAHGALAADAGRNTGDSTSAELLAEPQYVLGAAYQALLKPPRPYPIALPFDLWIETVRAFLAYFDTSLAQLLETFRATDDLFDPHGLQSAPYYRSQVFIESLGISPAEWAVFTAPDPAATWWTLYGYADEHTARTELTSAKTLSQRLGLTYKELIALVEAAFVDPQLATFVTLGKIGIDIGDVYRYNNAPHALAMSLGERAAFDAQLAAFTAVWHEKAPLRGFDAAVWVADRYADHSFDRILVLADPEPGCDFDRTTLQYANGDPISALDLVKLNLFVRLWRRLGWSMQEVDAALLALLPPGSAPLTSGGLPAALGTAIIYLAHISALASRGSLDAGARRELPSLWGVISTTGADSTYARVFLTPSALRNDPVFDDPVGDYLHDAPLFSEHRLDVQASLALSARDVDLILLDAGIDPATAHLTLSTASLLYRYGILARDLKMKINELIALKQLTGLDPFAPLQAQPLNADHTHPPLADIEDDRPFSRTLRFVEIARSVASSGLSVEELQYLLQHDAESVARFRPDRAPALALLKTLRTEIARIQSDNSAPGDASTLDDGTLRQKLALALPGPVVETLMAMWTGTVQWHAVAGHVLPADRLDPTTLAGQPLTLAYDAVTQEQRLVFTGVLLAPQAQAIKILNNSAVLSGLLDDVAAQARAFYDRWCAAFAAPADYGVLFAPIPADAVAAQAATAARRTRIASGLFPYVRARLTTQLVVTSVAAALDADPALTESLLTETDLLHDALATPATPLLEAFTQAGSPGVSARWYASADRSGVASLAIAATAETAAKTAGTNSARFEGCLEVPASGPYRFAVRWDKQNARATLAFAHLGDPVLSAVAAHDGDEQSVEVDLKAGILYPFTFDVESLGGGDARLLVAGESLPKDRLDRLVLYPAESLRRLQHADVVLSKVLRLASVLSLGERELRHMLTHAADFSQIDLSQLPAQDTIANVDQRFDQILRLVEYASLKRALGLDGDGLIDLFVRARRLHDVGVNADQAKADLLAAVCDAVAALTRRDVDTVRSTLTQLGFLPRATPVAGTLRVEIAELTQEHGARRVWDALALLEQLGIPAAAIGRWVSIVNGDAAHRDVIAEDVKNTIRSRFAGGTWYAVAQPIFDRLRKLKRDHLVAYICDKEHLERVDELYERFLLDPQMEPVVQTSRIQLAISSVQLFVDRCLLNLEPRVPPVAVIDFEQWQWMKRYRLWEADRRIFLFPENWLEPEFRIDKTGPFRDLESALLQGDVTPDAAEDAFLKYLQTLESIARLQMVSMYVEERDDATAVLHVVGRTYASPHKYHYRRYADNAWTPWEPIDAEVEGDHVVAVKWRDRLHLFWVTFVEKAEHVGPPDGEDTPRQLADVSVSASTATKVEIRLSWSALVNGAWTPRTSGAPLAAIQADVPKDFDRAKVAVSVTKETRPDGREGAVQIHLAVPVKQGFRIATKNSPPRIMDLDPAIPPTSYYSAADWEATLRTGAARLKISYVHELKTSENGATESFWLDQTILGAAPEGRFGLLLADSPLRLPRPDLAPLTGPFFFEDEVNTFFVLPELKEDTFDEWDGWVLDPGIDVDTDWIDRIPLAPQVPDFPPPRPGPGDPWAKVALGKSPDWVTDPATVIDLGGVYVHARGALDLSEPGRFARSTSVVSAAPGSAVVAGREFRSAARGDAAALGQGTSILIVGGAGLSAASPGLLGRGDGFGLAPGEREVPR